MKRARYQVLVIPFFIIKNEIKYAIFYRSDLKIWQFIAGGGEENESFIESAKREAYEEARIDNELVFHPLETKCHIPSNCFSNDLWKEDCFVIPEYCFGVKLKNTSLTLSKEHTKYKWVDYNKALKLLKYDSNKTALWELDCKIKKGHLK